MSEQASPARRHALQQLIASERRPAALALAVGRDDEPGHSPAGGAIAGGPRERGLAERIIKGVLRRRALLDAVLLEAARRGGARLDLRKTPGPGLWVLRMAVFEKIYQASAPDYAIVAQAVDLARSVGREPAARFTNALLRRLMPALPADAAALEASEWHQTLPAETRLSIPPEIIAEFGQAYGAAAGPVLQALAHSDAPTWLRVNTLKTNVEAAQASLAADGAQSEPALDLPALPALRWAGGAAPWGTRAWAAGELIVQDLAAQWASALLAPAPGSTVLDLCAAPGGKTTHLWELMRGQGRLVAWDVDAARRPPLAENLQRLHPGAPIELATDPTLAALAARLGAGCCDALMLDAPCQALGLLRRHPELRWDGRLAARAEVLATQRALLAGAAPLVRPGGRLLWVTCSPTLAENEALISEFLEKTPGWEPAPAPPGMTNHLQASRRGTLRSLPHQFPCDAFAYTLLQRNG